MGCYSLCSGAVMADCAMCKSRGWIRTDGDWVKCNNCHASGEEGVRAPDAILTSSGRISRGEHWMYGPAKPKPPELREVKRCR